MNNFKLMHALLEARGQSLFKYLYQAVLLIYFIMIFESGTRAPVDPQEGPSKGQASSDQS